MVGVPVRASAGGLVSGPALGVPGACSDRRGHPNALFALAEPRIDLDGTVTELTADEEQFRAMLDGLFSRLAEVTGREVGDIRADASQGRTLTAEQAISCGLLHGLVEPIPPA
jgi:ATP-dependent Clp protease protease subunit